MCLPRESSRAPAVSKYAPAIPRESKYCPDAQSAAPATHKQLQMHKVLYLPRKSNPRCTKCCACHTKVGPCAPNCTCHAKAAIVCEMSCVRWVAMSCVRDELWWDVWEMRMMSCVRDEDDEWCVRWVVCEMNCVRDVVWDELCVRWVVCDELCGRWVVCEMNCVWDELCVMNCVYFVSF